MVILKVTDLEPGELQRFLALEVGADAEDSFMTAAEKLTRETWARAQAEGRAKGHAAGRAEGRAEMLLRQLAVRFGSLPPGIDARVRAASIACLDRWAERVLTETSCDACS